MDATNPTNPTNAMDARHPKDMPDAMDAPDSADLPDATDAPDAMDAPDAPDAPDAMDAMDATNPMDAPDPTDAMEPMDGMDGMDGMDEILKRARELGEAAGRHERVEALRAASRAFEEDSAAQELRREYDVAVTRLQSNLAHGRPLEPDEKRKEADLRDRVGASKTIQALVRAQADFHEFLNRVNEEIQKAMDL